ncbi:MAG: FAD-binding oxidoreductase [Steroidobacteraceae bacterium]
MFKENLITRRLLLASLSAMGTALLATRSAAAQLLRTKTDPALASKLTETLQGKIFFKGDAAYEELRLAAVWNARKPGRQPPAIVMAESEADVVAAVRLAKAKGWQVGVRSTGHSWVAPHTRENALLINVSKLQEISIDAASKTATASPAIQGQVLGKALREQGLMFPSGHCYGVGLGGYILAGGHGWGSREWGPACANLKALDLVTAQGELIHADAKNNADYFWAARGAGPGYFGVVTRYYLNVHPMPEVQKASRYVYSIDVIEELLTWFRNNMNAFPKALEVLIMGGLSNKVPQIRISAVAMGKETEVDAALDLLEKAPFSSKALSKSLRNKVTLPAENENPTPLEPHGARIAIDGMWTNASAKELVPLMRELFTNYPTEESFVMWQCWGPVQKLDDMAYSIQGDVYLSNGAVYRDAADDARCDAWVTGNMKRMEHLSVGSMMNDEKMMDRKSRYLSTSATRRLEAMRAKHDPDRLFVSFLEAAPATKKS